MLKPFPNDKFSNQSPEEKETKLRKAELKREIKAHKKKMDTKCSKDKTKLVSSTDIMLLEKLQKEYKSL